LDTSHFSPSQREVVETGEGPLSVLAGPGSGKTTVLVGRIAYLVDRRGVPPAAVLAITFTTAAAATLRQRLSAILGTTAQALTVTTFHALGLRLIKQWSSELGFGDHLPAVYGREDARAVLREAATRLGLQLTPDVRQRDADPWALSLAKLDLAVERFRLGRTRAGATPSGQDEFDEDLLRPLAETYEALLKERYAIDYPAMLSLPLRLFADEPRALHVVQDAYRFVMADEAQDTCHTQFELLQHVVERHRNLAVVGDPKQAIFGWRGADSGILLDFQQLYPEAKVFPLDQNHRSTGVVVALSNHLAAPLKGGRESWTTNADGPRARIYGAADESHEARFVAHEVDRMLRCAEIEHPGQVAVLFRTNAQARALALGLRGAGVPFRVRADADLFAHPEVRDVVAYLRLAHCPTDQPAMARVVNVPPRRLRAIEQALRKRPVPSAELPLWAQKRGGPAARHSVEEFLKMLDELNRATVDLQPIQALHMVLERTAYTGWLANQKDGTMRLKHLEELEEAMENSPAPDLATWLVDMHVGDLQGVADHESKAVTLSTIHSAKGGEWPVVFVCGVEDGLLPQVRPTSAGEAGHGEDEERRLAYVAFSRAQVLLYLTYCQARRRVVDGEPGRIEPAHPSRFLRSLPAGLIERVESARVA